MEFNPPTRVTKYPREIPPLPWYRKTVPQMVMAGFLPFSAIYIELYYIFASVWGHKVGLDLNAVMAYCGIQLWFEILYLHRGVQVIHSGSCAAAHDRMMSIPEGPHKPASIAFSHMAGRYVVWSA